MAFQFETEAWEDDDGNRHRGKPSDVDAVYGMFIHAHDPKTGEDHHFWAFVYDSFDDWDQWILYIGALMEMHGMALS